MHIFKNNNYQEMAVGKLNPKPVSKNSWNIGKDIFFWHDSTWPKQKLADPRIRCLEKAGALSRSRCNSDMEVCVILWAIAEVPDSSIAQGDKPLASLPVITPDTKALFDTVMVLLVEKSSPRICISRTSNTITNLLFMIIRSLCGSRSPG